MQLSHKLFMTFADLHPQNEESKGAWPFESITKTILTPDNAPKPR